MDGGADRKALVERAAMALVERSSEGERPWQREAGVETGPDEM